MSRQSTTATRGQRARERAKLAAEHMRNAQRERGELGAATEEAETFAAKTRPSGERT